MEESIQINWRNVAYVDALAVLEQIQKEAESASTLPQMVKILTPSLMVQTATLSFIFHVLDPNGEPKTPKQSIWEMIPLFIKRLDDSQIDILFKDIIFTARHTAVYRIIAIGLRSRVKPIYCEAAILNQLNSSDPKAKSNARDLAYYVFGWDQDYWLSEEGKCLLEKNF